MKRFTHFAAAFAAAFLPAFTLSAQVLFSEDFSNGLGQWTGKNGGSHNAVVVNDPLNSGHGGVLTFTALDAGGNIFSAQPVSSLSPAFIRFDYLGLPGPGSVPGDLGGFLGLATSRSEVSRVWLASTSPQWPATFQLVDDGHWHTIQMAMPNLGSPTYLAMEDWVGSGGIPGDVFFDNIQVSTAPEPSPLLLLAAGIWLALRRRRQTC